MAVDLLRALIDEGEKKLRTLAKDHLSYQALEEAGKEDSKNTMEVASPAQESQAGKPKSLPKTGAEAEMISLGVCLLVEGLSVICNTFKRDQK